MVQKGEVDLNRFKETENEVFGVNYERYSLGKKIRGLIKKYNIKTVLEIPAHGAKAAPSLYSLDFAIMNCEVTLINGASESLRYYKTLGVDKNIKIVNVEDLQNTGLKSNSYDFVWNFAYLPIYENKQGLIEEMKRVSRRYISVFSVNDRNIGFFLHKFVHWKTKIPWTHGDANFNSVSYVGRFLDNLEVRLVESGVVDCPVWPDSIGFRDIRLHRSGKSFKDVNWNVPYIKYLKNNKFPRWFEYVHAIEKFPFPIQLKYLYAHIFYLIGEKDA